jgi:DNA-binding transcriptional LysR family regulator
VLTWTSRHLPSAIAAILTAHPKLCVTVEAGFDARLIDRLRQGELESSLAPCRRTAPMPTCVSST